MSIIASQVNRTYLDATRTKDQHEQQGFWRVSGQKKVLRSVQQTERNRGPTQHSLLWSCPQALAVSNWIMVLNSCSSLCFYFPISNKLLQSKSCLGQVLRQLKLLSRLFLRAAPIPIHYTVLYTAWKSHWKITQISWALYCCSYPDREAAVISQSIHFSKEMGCMCAFDIIPQKELRLKFPSRFHSSYSDMVST